VRDHDELRAVGVAAQQLDEAADVGVVERCLDLVEEIERARPREEEREEAIAPSAFSPPERRESRCTRFPAGAQLDLDAEALLVSSASVSLSRPSPPGKTVPVTSAK
jgi:hypothetical protein